MSCVCSKLHHPQRIVLTGGPGAGKTAVLELVRKATCRHVHVLPEAAGILFGGGFPRGTTPVLLRPAQRAIFHVQHELEETASGDYAIVLCDRGTVDGAAYWPGPEDLFEAVGTSHAEQLARYRAVIHLRTPHEATGYDRSNPLRIESSMEAAAIDDRIARVWADHPRYFEVPAANDFMTKATRAIQLVERELPACCLVRLPMLRTAPELRTG